MRGHYESLVNNISMLYQEVFKKEIDSLNSLTNNEDKIKLLKFDKKKPV